MKLPILMYHGVHSKKYPHVYKDDHIWTIDIEVFERHMDLIHSSGCEVVLLDHFLGSALLPEKQNKMVILTFDDGHESCYFNALPILNRYGFKAEFFITAGLIDKNGYMSKSQLNDLKKHGMSIQSHAYNHRFMSLLDKKELIFELRESKRKISEIISDNVRFFSYPGGRHDDRTEMAVREAGYQGSCTSEVGYNTFGNKLYGMKRFHYIDGMDERYFKAIITQDFKYFLLKKAWGSFLTIKRKFLKIQSPSE